MVSKTQATETQAGEARQTPADPRGIKIAGYFGTGLLRPGAGKLVQRTGSPQFCGSVVMRLFGYDESPSTIDKAKTSTRFSGEFFGITFEGKAIWANDGYLPSPLIRGAKAKIDAGETPVGFAGDVWCEPAEKTPLGYAFGVYDRSPRGVADPLMQLAFAAGIADRPALSAPSVGGDVKIDPETGEIIEPAGAA